MVTMPKTQTKINGTRIRCKGNIRHFEPIPPSIYNYARLGLISGNDFLIYSLLLKYTNLEVGYAYPTTKQIALATGISDATAKTALKNLEKVGLIRIRKATGFANKNIFYVDMPLEKEELEYQVPHLVEAFQEKEGNLQREAMTDKERLQQLNKFRKKAR